MSEEAENLNPPYNSSANPELINNSRGYSVTRVTNSATFFRNVEAHPSLQARDGARFANELRVVRFIRISL